MGSLKPVWDFLLAQGYWFTLILGFLWLGYLVVRPESQADQLRKDLPSGDWEMSTDVTGWQVLFNLRNKKWGPSRDTGLVTCLVMDPNGVARQATDTIPAKLPYEAAVYFRYPNDFGSPPAMDGVYAVRWETRKSALAAPELLAEGMATVKLTEPQPALQPPPALTSGADDGKVAVAELERTKQALAMTQAERENIRGALQAEVNKARSERHGFEQAWLTCKKAFGVQRLIWFAKRAEANMEAHNAEASHEDKVGPPRVTIRFVGYASTDFGLAKQIESILKEHTQWNLALDGGNNPALRPSNEFKVIFESSVMGSFREVAAAFSDGRLIDAAIGVRDHPNRFDHDLVIEVLPSVS